MGPEPTHQQLQSLVSAFAPGATLTHVRTLIGGISARSLKLDVEYATGTSVGYVVRQPGPWALARNKDAAQMQFDILSLVSRFDVPSPAPAFVDNDGALLGSPCVVMEALDGVPVYAPDNLNEYVEQFAAGLAQVHLCDVPLEQLVRLPDQHARLNHVIDWHPPQLDDSLREGKIREVLTSGWPLPKCETPRLLHGDYWPGNVLWQDGRLTALVDWEETEYGDPLGDLAITRLEMVWTFGHDAIDRFTAKYQALTGADLTMLPYWDLTAAIRPSHYLHLWAEGWPQMGRPDITAETMRQAHHVFVDRAFSALGIA